MFGLDQYFSSKASRRGSASALPNQRHFGEDMAPKMRTEDRFKRGGALFIRKNAKQTTTKKGGRKETAPHVYSV